MLLAVTGAFAQDNTQQGATGDWNPQIYQVGRMYPGYIIKLDGDTVKGFLKADTRCSIGGVGTSNQNQAAFYLNETDKKPAAKYKPDDIKGYMIADKVYESITYSGGMMKKPNFNLVVAEGAIRTYEWYSTVDGYMTLVSQSGETWQQYDARAYDTKTILAKDKEAPVEFGMLGLQFAKKMPEIISDYPELAKKVANKEQGYKAINIYEVIREYNTWAAAKK